MNNETHAIALKKVPTGWFDGNRYDVFLDGYRIGYVQSGRARNDPTGRNRGPSTGSSHHTFWGVYAEDGTYLDRDYQRKWAVEKLVEHYGKRDTP
jgi:hypothetical protein